MNLVINLNKPKGLTSQQAVTRVKRLLNVRKAGHTGTLDPMASGVLLVCLNEATKISRFLLNHDKNYHARLKLGEKTDTFDAEGNIIERRDIPNLEHDDIINVLGQFIGRIMQKPPMYSAIKIQGQPLYKLARKGIEIERAERPVTIHFIKLLRADLPYLDIAVSCSKGTYIRTLCDDIGVKLGTVAHLAALERASVGRFTLDHAVSLDALELGISPEMPFVYSIDSAISELPEIRLDETDYGRARNGMILQVEVALDLPENSHVRLKDPSGILFGIGRVDNFKIIIERNLNL